jgi:hypothetical protein
MIVVEQVRVWRQIEELPGSAFEYMRVLYVKVASQ